MNSKTTALYITIGLTALVAVINAISPFLSPHIAAILAVVASLAVGYLHPAAVNTAVATSGAQK